MDPRQTGAVCWCRPLRRQLNTCCQRSASSSLEATVAATGKSKVESSKKVGPPKANFKAGLKAIEHQPVSFQSLVLGSDERAAGARHVLNLHPPTASSGFGALLVAIDQLPSVANPTREEADERKGGGDG